MGTITGTWEHTSGQAAQTAGNGHQSIERNDTAVSRVARGLGWFSIGLGITELISPDLIGRVVGIRNHRSVIRGYGLREIAAGVGILAATRPSGWLRSRVAGDLIDLASLSLAARSSRNRERAKTAIGVAAVAGVTVLDAWCAHKFEQSETQPGPGSRAEASIIIDRTPQECYAFWRDIKNLPRVMSHIQSVEITGSKTSHWVAVLPGGARLEWDARVVNETPQQRIVWESARGSGIQMSGTVEFEPAAAGRGTIIRVAIDFGGPIPAFGAAATLIGKDPEQILRKELRRFKQALETGEVITTEGQPAGRSNSVTWLDRIAR